MVCASMLLFADPCVPYLVLMLVLQQHPAHVVQVTYSARAHCRVLRLVVASSCITCCGGIVVLRQYSGAAAAA